MFMTVRRHREEVAALQDRIGELQCFQAEQARRYETHIEDLRKLVFVPQYDRQPETFEVDAIIDAHEKPALQTEKERNEYLESTRQADLIFAGNHEEGFA